MDKMIELLNELIEAQRKQLLQIAQQIEPGVVLDDLLQPNDFLELEMHPIFRYEEGILAGLQTALAAVRARKTIKC